MIADIRSSDKGYKLPPKFSNLDVCSHISSKFLPSCKSQDMFWQCQPLEAEVHMKCCMHGCFAWLFPFSNVHAWSPKSRSQEQRFNSGQ